MRLEHSRINVRDARGRRLFARRIFAARRVAEQTGDRALARLCDEALYPAMTSGLGARLAALAALALVVEALKSPDWHKVDGEIAAGLGDA